MSEENEHFPLPAGEIVQLEVPIVSPEGLEVKITEVSDDANPDTVTVAVTPLGAASGLIVIIGVSAVTVNMANAESPELPLTLIVCAPIVPGGILPTVKEPVTNPLGEIVQEDSVTTSGSGVLVMGAQEPASAGLNPLPITVTTLVTGPDVGPTAIAAVELLTMNVAEAVSEVEPVTLTV
jgi:hypothetical protein